MRDRTRPLYFYSVDHDGTNLREIDATSNEEAELRAAAEAALTKWNTEVRSLGATQAILNMCATMMPGQIFMLFAPRDRREFSDIAEAACAVVQAVARKDPRVVKLETWCNALPPAVTIFRPKEKTQ